MDNIKYKAYIKKLNAIYDVWTMVFLDEWIRVFVKWLWQDIDKTNFLIDWVDNILMQSIWIYDKNWEEIFDWDIIQDFDKSHSWYWKKPLIVWQDTDDLWDWAWKWYQVTWNIYLNPELLWQNV